MISLAVLAASVAMTCQAPLPTGGQMTFALVVRPETTTVRLDAGGARVFGRIHHMEDPGEVVAAARVDGGLSASIIIQRTGRFQFTFNGREGPIFLYGECKR